MTKRSPDHSTGTTRYTLFNKRILKSSFFKTIKRSLKRSNLL